MKKFIYKITLFSAFLIIFYLVFIIATAWLLPSSLLKNNHYVRGENGFLLQRLEQMQSITKPLDILFIGSSRSYRGFDTSFFDSLDIHSFNLGSSNQTPIQTQYFLNKYLDKLNPKLVVFEVNPDMFSIDGSESCIDILSNGDIDFSTLTMAININQIRVYNTAINAWFRKIFGLNKLIHQKEIKGQKYVSGGYVKNDEQYFHDGDFSYSCQLLDKQKVAFTKIVQILASKKISLILVQSPITAKAYQSCHINQSFDEMMKKEGTYFNFNEILDINDLSIFFDSQHLNDKGVRRFNLELISKLDSLGKLNF